MANVKINDLAVIADPASTDVLPIVDVALDTTNKISIAGILKTVPAGTASAPSIAFEGDSNTGIYHPGSEQIGFTTSGSDAIRITSNGQIGIGTTDPDELLHIRGDVAEFKGTNTNPIDVTAGTEQIFKFGIEGQKNNVYGPAGSIIFRQDNSSWSSAESNLKPTRIELCTQDGTTTDTSETPRLVVDQNGLVGIGTTNPGYKLQISEASTSSVSIKSSGDNTTPRAVRLVCSFDDGDGASINATRATSQAAADVDLSFRTGGITNSEERLRITSDGNVGIGTTDPFTFLHVKDNTPGAKGNAPSSSGTTDPTTVSRIASRASVAVDVGALDNGTSYIQNRNQGNFSINYNFVINPNGGRVGIGTTDPVSLLNVRSPVFNTAETVASFGNSTIPNGLEIITNGNLDWGFNAKNSRNLTFSTNQTEAARIDSSGRMLVGTSNSRITGFGIIPKVQIEGVNAVTDAAQAITLNRTDNLGPRFVFAKSKGNTLNSNTIVAENDELGNIYFCGADGTDISTVGAAITANVDGTPGANDMPGRLILATTADGASSPTERMRITSDAYVRLASGTGGIQFNGDTAAANALDDYEEGTFTPVLNGTSTIGTGTYTLQQGRYTKIGKTVSIDIVLTWTAHTGAGTMFITGLPFTFGVGFGYRAPLSINTTGVSATVAYGDGLYGNISVPTTIAASGTIYINGIYQVA